MMEPGSAHLNSEGVSLSTADLLVLAGEESTELRQVWNFFHFQNNLVLTRKDEEVSHTDNPIQN